jgi:hypothetical protein
MKETPESTLLGDDDSEEEDIVFPDMTSGGWILSLALGMCKPESCVVL